MVIQVYPTAVAVFFFQIRPFLWQNMGMNIYFQILLLIREIVARPRNCRMFLPLYYSSNFRIEVEVGKLYLPGLM